MNDKISLKNKACIVGIGSTEFTRNTGRSELNLAVDATMAACKDAGLEPEQIDGCVYFGTAGSFVTEFVSECDVGRSLNIRNFRYFVQAPWGGGSGCANIMQAAMAVATGLADYVLVYRSIRTGSGTVKYGKPVNPPIDSHHSWVMPFGLMSPTSWVAMITRRWMQDTGATNEQLGWSAVVCRENAAKNPRAIYYERPITIDDYFNSPMVCDPFRLHDTCCENDGAVALIVTSPERAKDLSQKPAYIRGAAVGTGWDQFCMTSYYRDCIWKIDEQEHCANDLFKMAELESKDIDVAQFYDAFTSEIPLQLESFGFVKPGEGGEFCQGGDRIRIGGELPINTSGGQLSEAYIHGLTLIAEGARQIRGTAINQVEDAENVLVTSSLGVPSSALILSNGR